MDAPSETFPPGNHCALGIANHFLGLHRSDTNPGTDRDLVAEPHCRGVTATSEHPDTGSHGNAGFNSGTSTDRETHCRAHCDAGRFSNL